MDDKRILDAVRSPADLKLLSDEELALLACEIREEIVTVTSQTGGHVASSLGAVEIILAAHSLLDCPTDKLVFDVGHQAYAHKLVTGRLDLFDTLRTYGGVSGFPKPDESPYDVHPSGHASDSLSVALGLAKARDLRGGTEKVVAVIGDAALSGGMAFEALNHIGQAQTPLVIILNDNEMSISRNVGALMKHLGYMRASTQYRQTRDSLQEKLESSGPFGTALANFGRNMKESMKQFVIPRSMIFEQLGILCTAPIDGHDIGALRETLSTVLATDGPVLMHVVTKKGAGYEPASRNPERFHGVGPYDIATGELVKKEAAAPSYTDVFGQAIVREARQNPDIVAITAAMKDGTGLAPFAEEFPDRFVDAGIAEEHAVGMAAGLAAGGKKPVVAIYSTFLQRAIDQMTINCALPGLDVVFAIDRAGIVERTAPHITACSIWPTRAWCRICGCWLLRTRPNWRVRCTRRWLWAARSPSGIRAGRRKACRCRTSRRCSSRAGRTWCVKVMTWPSSRSGAWCRARWAQPSCWQSAACRHAWWTCAG